jgi:hypothetical protein
MGSFLQEMFLRFGEAFATGDGEEDVVPSCTGALTQAVEHIVDETYSRLRLLPGYARRLKGPVTETFRYIDALVEGVPGGIECCRSAFSEDPRVNAFFVDPGHLQEVFSCNPQVRDLLDANPEVGECWALLCMRMDERRQLGISLVGDSVQRDVMQTAVSFTDHQVIAPGSTEDEARRSLKCCIFNGLLSYIRKQADDAKTRAMKLEVRRKSLCTRVKQVVPEQDPELLEELQKKIEDLELELAQETPRLASLEDYLDFVVAVLENPMQYLNGRPSAIRLSRLGIKQEGDSGDAPGDEIPLYTIQVAWRAPRVGVLVRFPRAELLPRHDFVRNADLFLAL